MDATQALNEYRKARPKLSGIETFEAAQLYAEDAGAAVAKIFATMDLEELAAMSTDDLAALLRPALRAAYGDSVNAAAMAQRIQNAQAQLGLGVLEADFDAATVRAIAEQLVGKEFSVEFLENLIKQETLKGFDETVRKNAEARDNMGLKVHIVRTYSDVGLRSGTKYAEPCEWCLSRCGEWDNYKEAYAAGCFERHPGCGCIIEYEVGKTHTIQRAPGNWQQV